VVQLKGKEIIPITNKPFKSDKEARQELKAYISCIEYYKGIDIDISI